MAMDGDAFDVTDGIDLSADRQGVPSGLRNAVHRRMGFRLRLGIGTLTQMDLYAAPRSSVFYYTLD